MPAVIHAEHLTKRFGKRVLAVDDVSFSIAAGTITGVLGPNGAGKTTTLRMILDLVRPTSGSVTILGSRYRDLRAPAARVGALLDASGFHPGRSGRNALRVIATGAGVPDARVDETLELVELTGDGRRAVKGYSTGMKQRLALAAALLGDPEVLILDEPANGLDPEGIAWLRALLQGLAAEGRTVLISSHLLSEVAQTVDRVVIVAKGRLKFAGSLAELGRGTVWVRSVEAPRLAAAERIALAELTSGNASLEAAFLRLTADPSAAGPAAGSRRLLPRSLRPSQEN